MKNGGKCGVCGDNVADPQPRPHEGGGKYGQGVIGRRYTTGQVKYQKIFYHVKKPNINRKDDTCN